jgi:hypothetical protein
MFNFKGLRSFMKPLNEGKIETKIRRLQAIENRTPEQEEQLKLLQDKHTEELRANKKKESGRWHSTPWDAADAKELAALNSKKDHTQEELKRKEVLEYKSSIKDKLMTQDDWNNYKFYNDTVKESGEKSLKQAIETVRLSQLRDSSDAKVKNKYNAYVLLSDKFNRSETEDEFVKEYKNNLDEVVDRKAEQLKDVVSKKNTLDELIKKAPFEDDDLQKVGDEELGSFASGDMISIRDKFFQPTFKLPSSYDEALNREANNAMELSKELKGYEQVLNDKNVSKELKAELETAPEFKLKRDTYSMIASDKKRASYFEGYDYNIRTILKGIRRPKDAASLRNAAIASFFRRQETISQLERHISILEKEAKSDTTKTDKMNKGVEEDRKEILAFSEKDRDEVAYMFLAKFLARKNNVPERKILGIIEDHDAITKKFSKIKYMSSKKYWKNTKPGSLGFVEATEKYVSDMENMFGVNPSREDHKELYTNILSNAAKEIRGNLPNFTEITLNKLAKRKEGNLEKAKKSLGEINRFIKDASVKTEIINKIGKSEAMSETWINAAAEAIVAAKNSEKNEDEEVALKNLTKEFKRFVKKYNEDNVRDERHREYAPDVEAAISAEIKNKEASVSGYAGGDKKTSDQFTKYNPEEEKDRLSRISVLKGKIDALDRSGKLYSEKADKIVEFVKKNKEDIKKIIDAGTAKYNKEFISGKKKAIEEGKAELKRLDASGELYSDLAKPLVDEYEGLGGAEVLKAISKEERSNSIEKLKEEKAKLQENLNKIKIVINKKPILFITKFNMEGIDFSNREKIIDLILKLNDAEGEEEIKIRKEISLIKEEVVNSIIDAIAKSDKAKKLANKIISDIVSNVDTDPSMKEQLHDIKIGKVKATREIKPKKLENVIQGNEYGNKVINSYRKFIENKRIPVSMGAEIGIREFLNSKTKQWLVAVISDWMRDKKDELLPADKNGEVYKRGTDRWNQFTKFMREVGRVGAMYNTQEDFDYKSVSDSTVFSIGSQLFKPEETKKVSKMQKFSSSASDEQLIKTVSDKDKAPTKAPTDVSKSKGSLVEKMDAITAMLEARAKKKK